MNNIDEECTKRLLSEEITFDSNITTPEKQDTKIDVINELSHPDDSKTKSDDSKKKFTVIKYFDSGPSNKVEKKEVTATIENEIVHKNNLQSDKWDFDEISIKSGKFRKEINNNEEDDLFSDELLKDFFKEQLQNVQNMREGEGYDTITSLSNNVFKKQLEKIKRKASTRNLEKDSTSHLSTSSSLNRANLSLSVNNDNDSICDRNSLFETSSMIPNTPKVELRSFLEKNGGSGVSSRRSSIKFFGSSFKLPTIQKNISQSLNKSILELNQNQNAKAKSPINNAAKDRQKSVNLETELNKEISHSNQAVNVNASKSDQVFDVLREAIHNNDNNLMNKKYIESVIQAVKKQQLKHQRKKDKARRVCLIAEITVFLFVFVMSFFFIKSVIHQLNLIQNLSKISLNQSSNANNHNFQNNYKNFSIN